MNSTCDLDGQVAFSAIEITTSNICIGSIAPLLQVMPAFWQFEGMDVMDGCRALPPMLSFVNIPGAPNTNPSSRII